MSEEKVVNLKYKRRRKPLEEPPGIRSGQAGLSGVP